MARWLLALILCGLPLSFGQTTNPTRDQLRADAIRSITSLNSKLEELRTVTPREKQLQAACAVNCSDPKLLEEMDDLAAQRFAAVDAILSQMDDCIDGYIVGSVNPKHADLDRELVVQDLKQILGKVAVDPPSAYVLNSAKSRSLIVFYTLGGWPAAGAHATSVTLRSYNATGGGLQLADVSGDDMNGYANVAVKELHSPVPGETWLLVWGQATGANGPNIRMRVYAYDGMKFKTMWMPANVWGTFTVSVTDNGFKVDGPYYREDRQRHDRYLLTSEGLYLKSINE